MRPLLFTLFVLSSVSSSVHAGTVYFDGLSGSSGSFVTADAGLVNYTITKGGDITSESTLTSPPYTTRNGTFETTTNLPYFYTTVASPNGSIHITFDKAIEAKDVVLYFGDIVNTRISGQYSAISLPGSTGTATLADFNLIDTGIFGNPDTNVSYNSSSGVVSNNNSSGSAADIFIGSTSTHTLTSINLYAQQPIYLFELGVGVTTVPVPEPSSFALLGLGGFGLAIGAYRRRRATV